MKRTIAIFVSLIILVIMLLPNSSNAEPDAGVVKISTDAETIEIGDKVTISVTQYEKDFTDVKKTKYVKFKLNYDTDIFTYESISGDFDIDDAEGTITVLQKQNIKQPIYQVLV